MIVLVFDTEVRSVATINAAFLERTITWIRFARGGGTSFVEAIEDGVALDPSIIVVLTDLEGPFGPAPGRTPVLWCVPRQTGASRRAPFGTVIELRY